MIYRLVKMKFQEGKDSEFIVLFDASKEFIRSFQGCHGLELLKDSTDKRTFFTLSKWDSESDLENYRSSPFFKTTWSKAKELFEEKAMAWTLSGVVPSMK